MSDHTIMVIWVIMTFSVQFFCYSCHLFLISSASLRSIPFLSFIIYIFAWNVPLVSQIFLKRSLLLLLLLCRFSCVRLSATPWTAAPQASLSFTIPQSLLKLMSIESVISSNHLFLCCPLLVPSIFPASGSFPMNRLFTLGGQNIELQL